MTDDDFGTGNEPAWVNCILIILVIFCIITKYFLK